MAPTKVCINTCMKSSEFITEDDDNVVKGDFGKKGGPKVQTQHAKKISLAQAFMDEGYNILLDNGIKLKEKPSYWQDLEKDPLGEVTLQKIKKLFAKNGVELPEFDAWEIYPIAPDDEDAMSEADPEDLYVSGPLVRVENMPFKGTFVIRTLPYRESNREPLQYGDFLVDSVGASSYIRFWRKIK